MFKVKKLFLKPLENPRTLLEVSELKVNTEGIEGSEECLNLRQVLFLPSSTIQEFTLNAGDLKENIVT